MRFSKLIKPTLILSSVAALSACGGGSSGVNSLRQFESQLLAFQTDPSLGSATPQDTVNAQRGTATYDGIINISVAQSTTNSLDVNSYYGNIAMNVDFVDGPDSVTGTASNFVLYNSFVASSDVGSSAPGSISFSGVTTQNNESIGDGMTGTMTGTIDGVDTSGTFSGSITGVSANGMRMYLDGPGLGGGVALLVD